MALEEKYAKPKFDYYVAVIWRKISSAILGYPEFIFLGKILAGLLVLAILFLLFKSRFGV